MLLIFMASFTAESAIMKYGYRLIPSKLSLDAYRVLLRSPILGNSYAVTVFVTVVGTVSAVIITAMAAYTLANKQVKFRNTLAFYFFFTMLFNGGIVPWYLVCRSLGLINNMAALIIPSLLFSPFNMFLVRNFMMGIPDSLMESARIDGARDTYIAFKIYFPLSIPVFAAVTLFCALAYWNNWWNAIMLVDKKELYPLQFLLLQIRSRIRMLRELKEAGELNIEVPAQSIQMATTIVTIGPIVLLYPFLQRFFLKGILLGSIKA